ncbi:MAG TPA: methyl-accepting chemotaxis protein [Rickettsiales bacterium]|nr:methyl-accepting chemotaxis protein [Rickettsiales bacterium]
MALDNVSISRKVQLSFLLMFCIISGVGGFSIDRLGTVYKSAEELHAQWIPSMSAAGALRTQLKNYTIAKTRLIIANLLAKDNAELIKSAEAQFAQETEALKKNRDAYTRYIVSGTASEKLMNDFDIARATFESSSVAIVNAAKAGDVKTLLSLYLAGEDGKAFSDAVSAMNGIVDFDKNMAKATAERGDKIYEQTRLLLICTVICAALVCALLGVLIINSTSKPVTIISGLMSRLARNDFNITLFGTQRGDEIGEMARSVEVFYNNGKEKIRLEQEIKERERIAEQEKKAFLRKLVNEFESSIQGIITIVASASTELYQTAENMRDITDKVSTQSGKVSSASSQAYSNVQGVAAAVEEMSTSVKEISSQVSKTSSLMLEAVSKTDQADRSARLLSSAVVQISDILTMIETIAGQINLLALNATIESARAGDAGKGFAVVASEVKNLANQTSKATETIAGQIGNIRSVSEDVTKILAEIHEAVNHVNQYAGGMAAAVEEQSATTGEISTNMQSASHGVQEIASNIVHVSEGIRNADHAAKDVLDAAQTLSKQAEILNTQVKLFLEKLMA